MGKGKAKAWHLLEFPKSVLGFVFLVASRLVHLCYKVFVFCHVLPSSSAYLVVLKNFYFSFSSQ